MNQTEINNRSGGLSEVTRKRLAREVVTSEQNLSSLIKRLVHPHIHPELLESAGVFTNLGLQFMRELFSLEASQDEALGVIRKRFILTNATSDKYQQLYKSWNPVQEPDFVIELPQEEPLPTAIEAYHQATLAVVQDESPDFLQPVESASLTRVESGLYSLFYRRFRQMGQAVVADAFADAMADTLNEAEVGLAFQMGKAS